MNSNWFHRLPYFAVALIVIGGALVLVFGQ